MEKHTWKSAPYPGKGHRPAGLFLSPAHNIQVLLPAHHQGLKTPLPTLPPHPGFCPFSTIQTHIPHRSHSEKFSLGKPGFLWTQDLPASASQALGLKVCRTPQALSSLNFLAAAFFLNLSTKRNNPCFKVCVGEPNETHLPAFKYDDASKI